MKIVQIVPSEHNRLYSAMVRKEADIRKKGAGTFRRSGTKQRDKAKWKHVRFQGWINLKRDRSEIVTAKVKSRDWQLLAAFVGWVDRHFGDQVKSMNIEYPS